MRLRPSIAHRVKFQVSALSLGADAAQGMRRGDNSASAPCIGRKLLSFANC
jgi:hypothetical protein